MTFFRRGAVVAAVAALGAVLFSGGVASAATSPIAACGSSYHVQESHDIKGLATVYLMYNGSTNCVVTWHSAALQGVARYTSATVQKQGGSPVEDAGTYSSYAGPVKVNAPGVCITFSGMISDGNGRLYGYESPWGHCG